MKDDDFFRELAQANRETEAEERRRLDERWDRLNHGQLSPEEDAELRALAETSEEAREAYEAFRPLGPEFQAGVLQAIRAQGLPEAEPPVPKRRAKLLPFSRRAQFAGWSAAAAAASVLMMIFLRASGPLPVYVDMKVSGGTSMMRGEQPTAREVFAPGDPIRVALRPQTTASYGKRLEAQGFLSCDREVRRLELRSQIEPNGAVQMNGLIDRGVLPGFCTLWAVVCRRGKLPEPAALRSLSTEGPVRQRDCVAMPRDIRIQPRGS
jgi:hypothetical protein